jgi:formylmethanofuran dehydrogenase subunit C
MSATRGWCLRLKAQPDFRVDFGGVVPARLAGMTSEEVARVEVRHGNGLLALGELFAIAALGGGAGDPGATCATSRAGAGASTDTAAMSAAESTPEPALELRLEGDLSRFDAIGQGLDGGVLRIAGAVGDRLGLAMRGGEIHVHGAAGQLAGCEMAGGLIEVTGDVGDFAAGALPGSMDGMRGGTLIVRGKAGARCGDRMRRGTVVVHGDAGDFLASRMVAGTIAVAGRVGAHCGYGMRRGTLVFAGPPPTVPPTFVATHQDIVVFWTLLRRSLAYHGGPFAALPAHAPRRLVGDLAADGRGEWLLPE